MPNEGTEGNQSDAVKPQPGRSVDIEKLNERLDRQLGALYRNNTQLGMALEDCHAEIARLSRVIEVLQNPPSDLPPPPAI